MSPPQEIIRKLEEIVGPENVSVEPAELICYARDFSFIDVKTRSLPDAVVWPTSTEQVAGIVKLANELKIPVIPRGAGTGECGGAMPVKGGIVVDLFKMSRVIELNKVDMWVLVEPGIVGDELNKFLSKHGFFYPPVPASSEMATIGGNVATNAAGYRTVKYGSTSRWVMALEVVLPSGEVIWTGSKTRKTSSGYDLTRLFVGSEGTLGIFTKIMLRIHPLPECRTVLTAHYDSIDDACKTVMDIMSGRIFPSAVEIMDRMSIQAVINYGVELPRAEAIVIVELDGDRDDVERRMKTVKEVLERNRALGVSAGVTEEEQNRLWRGRKSITPALASIKPNVIDEDVCVPVSRLLELFKGIEEISRNLGVDIATYGHAGDGNLHPDILFDKRNPEEVEKAVEAVKMIRGLTIKLGGTITGEHGIGLRRAPSLSMEHSAEAIEAMKALKMALDPNNIMNPGKIFP